MLGNAGVVLFSLPYYYYYYYYYCVRVVCAGSARSMPNAINHPLLPVPLRASWRGCEGVLHPGLGLGAFWQAPKKQSRRLMGGASGKVGRA